MAVNYFGYDATNDVNDIVEEIEYRVVSNKLDKLPNPIGNKIIESTEAGDIKETDRDVNSFIEQINTLNQKNDENYRKLNTKKLQKFSSNTPRGNIVVTRDNGGLIYTEINAETLKTRVEDNKTSVENLETHVEDNKTSVENLETRVDTNKRSVEALETRVEANETSVGALEMKDLASYINVSAELSGPVAIGDIFSHGSGASGNLRGGYVVMSDGMIVKGSLSCVGPREYTSRPAKVSVCVNGIPSTQKMELSRVRDKLVKIFNPPIPVRVGDKILFGADRPVSDAESTIASVLIRSSH